MSTLPSCRELQTGPLGTVWGVEQKDGSCPAEDFLRGLDVRAKAQFKARFEAIVQVGTLRTPEMGRYLNVPGSPKIYEVKVDAGPGYRLYIIRIGANWYATHGCKKPKDRKVAKEADRARQIYGAGGGE